MRPRDESRSGLATLWERVTGWARGAAQPGATPSGAKPRRGRGRLGDARRRPLVRRAGYTVIEVMMALSVLSIGTTGVIAMQKVTLIGNTRARDLATATAIAAAWVERLRYDGLRWTYDPATGVATLGSTTYLSQPQNVWFVPPPGGPSGTAVGGMEGLSDVKGMDTVVAAEGAFCVNVRLTNIMNNPIQPAPIPAAMRAEVRVYWLKMHHTTVNPALSGTLAGNPFCSTNQADIDSLDTAADGTTRYHFAYASTAILRNDL